MFTDKLPSGGRAVGVGIDIMRRDSIYAPYLNDGDPFLRATYSLREQEAASKRSDPYKDIAEAVAVACDGRDFGGGENITVEVKTGSE